MCGYDRAMAGGYRKMETCAAKAAERICGQVEALHRLAAVLEVWVLICFQVSCKLKKGSIIVQNV